LRVVPGSGVSRISKDATHHAWKMQGMAVLWLR
jgi:hypothetical protein